MKATVLFGLLISVAIVNGAAIKKSTVNNVPVPIKAPVANQPTQVVEEHSFVEEERTVGGKTVVEEEDSSNGGKPVIKQFTEDASGKPLVVAKPTVAAKPAVATTSTANQPTTQVVEQQSFVKEERTVGGKTVVEEEESSNGGKPVIKEFTEDVSGKPAVAAKPGVAAKPAVAATSAATATSGTNKVVMTSENKPAVATASAVAYPAEDEDYSSCEESEEDNNYPNFPTYPNYQSTNPFLYQQYPQYLTPGKKPPVSRYPAFPIQGPGSQPGYPQTFPQYPSPYYPQFPNFPQYPPYYSPLARRA